MKNDYQNFKLRFDEKGVLWLGIDRQGSSVNTLNHSLLQEFDGMLDDIAKDTSIKSVIIYSEKKVGFIAGADISQFTELKTADQAFKLIRQGQLVFDKLAVLPQPTVAMIDGFCLGGGLELALACKYRVADDSRHTKIGLPEVLLGIQPGWGGTIRLPLLIGAPNAMKLILSGKIISAQEAAKLGIIDDAVPKRTLEKAAMHYALQAPKPHQPSFVDALTNHGLVRPLLVKVFTQNLKAKISEDHYPAPFAVIRNWEELGPESPQAMVQEARSISELMVSPTARNLVRAFFLKERLKGLAKGFSFKAKHVHVIGAGTMGSAIAAWCAISGLTVTLQDQTPKFIAAGMKKAYGVIKSKQKSSREVMLTMDRLTPDLNGTGIAKADVIIEAIIEDLGAKHALYREIESKMKPTAILATNTSSLPLAELSKVLKLPNQLIGIHFFNPVEKMELVEIVYDSATDKERINDAIAFVKQINRLPLPVLSKPGFLVNRILMPYLLESVLLLQEGVPASAIDKAAKKFGMPMGPIELADRVGLDVCLSVAQILTRHLGGEVPGQLQQLVSEGKLGVKSGEGFYRYHNGKVMKTKKEETAVTKMPEDDIIDRLILRMLNEAAACLRETIVSDADLLDAGMIFGTGFAPFRGGPMQYARTRGIPAIRQRLEELMTQYGERFTPDAGWQSLDDLPETSIHEQKPPKQQETHVH
ncbi:MAG: enoyl-CoA hydratase/isomerase family protein [Gammaproteobacteria bacterium]|nr:enoyl-CoA hydratase/isomerase family protein [Gammaproteobacteria bacterium]